MYIEINVYELVLYIKITILAIIKNIATGIEKNCDILRKNDNILEVVLEGTTIKILLKKKTNKYIGYFKEMEFESDG